MLRTDLHQLRSGLLDVRVQLRSGLHDMRVQLRSGLHVELRSGLLGPGGLPVFVLWFHGELPAGLL